MQIKSINLNEYQKNCTTGATSGVGKETARVLAKRGAHVIMAVRNTKAGEETKLKFLEEDPSATLDVMQLDLGSLASVRKFAGDFRAQNLPLNILINNAGAVLPDFELSEDGMEKTFATNHIGPFLLTNLLLDTMKKTAKDTGEEGRIVMVASHAHALASKGIPYDSLNDKKR
jgi:NAD(P)-dependent dehydrogenase (short-subunit alcohol dehydrogenase family)